MFSWKLIPGAKGHTYTLLSNLHLSVSFAPGPSVLHLTIYLIFSRRLSFTSEAALHIKVHVSQMISYFFQTCLQTSGFVQSRRRRDPAASYIVC